MCTHSSRHTKRDLKHFNLKTHTRGRTCLLSQENTWTRPPTLRGHIRHQQAQTHDHPSQQKQNKKNGTTNNTATRNRVCTHRGTCSCHHATIKDNDQSQRTLMMVTTPHLSPAATPSVELFLAGNPSPRSTPGMRSLCWRCCWCLCALTGNTLSSVVLSVLCVCVFFNTLCTYGVPCWCFEGMLVHLWWGNVRPCTCMLVGSLALF